MPVMDNAAAGVQPQQQPQVPAGAAEAPRQEPLDFTAAIDGMTDEHEIGALLFGDQAPKPQPTAEPEPSGAASDVPPPADPPANPAAAAAQAQPQEPATTEPQEPAASSLERISLKSLHPDDRVMIAKAKELVREGKAVNFADAIKSLTSDGTQEPAPAQAADPASPEPQPAQPTPATVEQDPDVVQIQSDLAALRAQRKAAVEEFDRATELDLTDQIEDALARLAEAKSAAVIRQRESATQDQAIDAIIEEIYVAHPESEDPKSFFSYRMQQELDAYEEAHGPIGRHPRQLKVIADRVAAELAPSSPAAGTPQPAAQQPAAQPRQSARPIGSAAPGSAAAVRHSPDQIQKLIDTADAETLRSALFGEVPA